jgi:host factor-I protein
MSEKAQTVQEAFLGHLRDNRVPTTVFLINGIKLQGVIDEFDKFSVVLRRDRHSQLILKGTISTIMPMMRVDLFEEEPSPPRSGRTLSLRY